MEKVPAIPRTELAPNCSLVPLSVTLNRLAAPERVEVPTKLAVPPVAVKLPETEKSDLMEKLTEVEMAPRTFKPLKMIEPLPLTVLAGPVMVIVPAVADNAPETLRFPPIVREAAVEIEPAMVRWLKVMPIPLITLLAPFMVRAPGPPARWVKVPTPLVVRFPATARLVLADAVIPVPPLNAPLFDQLPPTEMAKAPALNVVDGPIETLPWTVMAAAAVKESEVPAPKLLVRSPAIVMALLGMVLTATPLPLLSLRFP